MDPASASHLRPVPDVLEDGDILRPGRNQVADRLITAGARVAIAAALVQGIVHGLNAITIASPQLDVNGEHNVFSWASSSAALAVAAGAGLAWLAGGSQRRRLLALAACVTYLSVDDAIMLHENMTLGLMGLVGIPGVYGSIIWPALYLPLLLATAVLLVRASEHAPARGRLTVLWGLALLGSAVVLEVMSAPWSNDHNLQHTIAGGFEESAELAGWILIATGVATIALQPVRRLSIITPQSSVK